MMPFNFTTSNEYRFDFNVLYKTMMENSIFKQYEFYVRRWVHIFENIELLDRTDSDHFLNRKNFGEFFQYGFSIEDQVFYLHFNIETIKHSVLAEPQPYPLQALPLSVFGTTRGFVQYTNEPYQMKNIPTNTPIILCEFPIEDTRFIVIDGNHRVTSLIKKGEKNVDVVGCHPMNRKSFMSNVDWAMYLFKLESYHISYRVDQGENFNSLVKISNAYNVFKNV